MNSLTPNLMVEDVNKTIEYYEKVLGFELSMNVPKTGKFDWAMMKHENVEIMFQERNNLIEEYPVLNEKTPGGGLTFYIRVKDVKKLHDELKEKANIVLDLQKTFYGTEEFAIIDINGYILTFSA
ncbi:MAG: bleomycin resistance family protein [Clostridiaceae bacterium]|mgnify:CR=1 FL=1|nr:bleomycin resistance family protein [Clostridiaceae bacterium]